MNAAALNGLGLGVYLIGVAVTSVVTATRSRAISLVRSVTSTVTAVRVRSIAVAKSATTTCTAVLSKVAQYVRAFVASSAVTAVMVGTGFSSTAASVFRTLYTAYASTVDRTITVGDKPRSIYVGVKDRVIWVATLFRGL